MSQKTFPITIAYTYCGSQTFLCSDRPEQEEHFKIISEAVERYQRFKNDGGETVSVKGATGGQTIIRLEHVVSVNMGGDDEVEQTTWAECRGHSAGIFDKAKRTAKNTA